MKNQTRSYLFALTTVLLWSTSATAFKIALRDLNNIQLLLIANFSSLLVFFFILFFQGKMNLLRQIKMADIGLSALQGLLNPFAYYLILFKAYSMLPAQVAQPTNFVWPIVLMLLSVPLLKQPLRLMGVISLLISFGGVFILGTQGQLSSFKIAESMGLMLSLTTAVIWSLFWILNLRDKRDDLLKLFLSFTFSMIYIVLTAICMGDSESVLSKPMIPAIYIGLFEMGFSFVFWLKALQYSESTGKVANLIYLTPFASMLIIHLVLHEKLYFTSVAGLCLIIAGILIGQIKSNQS
jgi:drug/metabolite transporter (DMT)-like permease